MQTNLKRIGNSFEVILNKKLLKEAGIVTIQILLLKQN